MRAQFAGFSGRCGLDGRNATPLGEDEVNGDKHHDGQTDDQEHLPSPAGHPGLRIGGAKAVDVINVNRRIAGIDRRSRRESIAERDQSDGVQRPGCEGASVIASFKTSSMPELNDGK
jgi:hypothetical protein